MRVLLVSANREKLPAPVVPLGVLSVASSVGAEHDVRVVDLCFEDDPVQALCTAVKEHGPDVIGLGIRNLHTNAYDGTERLVAEYAALVDAVRGVSRAKVVLGGAGFSLRPNMLLERLSADHGVVGEGEIAFRDLVDGLSRHQPVERIVEAAAVSSSPVVLSRARRSELDRLPLPARERIDPRYFAYDGTDAIQTKRGCAFSCTYCDYPDLEGRKVRLRDPELVADEVLSRSKVPGVTHLFFVDSVFNVPRSHALAVCRALVRRGSPLPWVCYGSPVAFDDELVEAMAAAGCLGVEIGTDSGSERILRRLKKPFDLSDVLRTRELFLKHGIHDCHTFVLGAEGETPEEVEETFAFVERLAPDVAAFIVFMEDRESHVVHRAGHRDAILELLARTAPNRPGWVVPELGIRFGPLINKIVLRAKLRGPSWLYLARPRRQERVSAAE
jgi:hypothetical protein